MQVISRQELRLKWFSFKNWLAKVHKEPPANWLQSYGILFSVILSIVAIMLTIQISKQQTDVKNMQEVLNELTKQNIKLDSQISAQRLSIASQEAQLSELTQIADRSLTMIENLNLINKSVQSQNNTLAQSSEPKLSITGKASYDQISDSEVIFNIETINVGQRQANAIKYEMALVEINNTFETCKVIHADSIGSLQPTEKKHMAIRLKGNQAIDSDRLKDFFYKIKLIWADPMFQRHNLSRTYHISTEGDGYDVSKIRFAMPTTISRMEKLIKQKSGQ